MRNLTNQHGHASISLPHRKQPTYSDEHVRFWSTVYSEHKLHSQGIVFEIFMQFPSEIIRAIKTRGYRPLIKSQRAVREHLDTVYHLQKELEDNNQIACRNGTFIEPLHHCTHPRHGIKH